MWLPHRYDQYKHHLLYICIPCGIVDVVFAHFSHFESDLNLVKLTGFEI